MNWTTILVVCRRSGCLLFSKRSGQISIKEAQAHLKNGALVIDVRTPGEFISGHLPGAINLPLDEIEAACRAA